MFESSHRPDGKMADVLAPTHACLHNCERFGQLQYVRATEALNISPRHDGKMADLLAATHALHNCECFAQLQGVRAAETLHISHRPHMGNSRVLVVCRVAVSTSLPARSR